MLTASRCRSGYPRRRRRGSCWPRCPCCAYVEEPLAGDQGSWSPPAGTRRPPPRGRPCLRSLTLTLAGAEHGKILGPESSPNGPSRFRLVGLVITPSTPAGRASGACECGAFTRDMSSSGPGDPRGLFSPELGRVAAEGPPRFHVYHAT